MFDQLVTARALNMVALAASVLWLLTMLSSISGVADQTEDAAAWDYVAATSESSGFLVVTVIAWLGAAVLQVLTRD